MKKLLAIGVMLLVLGATAKADQVTGTWLSIAGSAGSYDTAGFTVHDTSNGLTFPAFCVDLSDDSYGPGTSNPYTATLTYGAVSSSLPTITNTNKTGAANELTYLVGTVWMGAALTNSEITAFQAALWSVLTGSAITPNGDATATSIYSNLETLLGGNTVTNSDWAALDNVAAYSSGTPYNNPDVVVVTPAGTLGSLPYQILIGYVPEPSSMAIAGIGAMGFLAYGLRRRKVS